MIASEVVLTARSERRHRNMTLLLVLVLTIGVILATGLIAMVAISTALS